MFTESKIIFNDIYPHVKGNIESQEIDRLFDFLNKVKPYPYQIISKSLSSSMFQFANELIFASEKIKNSMDDYNIKYHYQLEFPNNTVNVNIYSKEKLKNNTFLNEIFRYIQFIISIHPVDIDITINYHLTNEKKYFRDRIPTKEDVNSGSCTISDTHCIINIWRKEEILKVTLHEMFHALKHDRYKDTSEIIEVFKQKYNLNSEKINTHEAYTETWANLINCFLISQTYEEKNKNFAFKNLVAIEKYHTLFQAQKILTKIGRNKVNLDKNTNVTAYFLIRGEIYQDLDSFLEFCRTENENYVRIKNTNNWLVFLSLKNRVKKDSKLSFKKNSYLNKNLRMSIIDLQLSP